VDYAGVKALKRELLEAAWDRFRKGDGRSGRSKLFTQFLEQQDAWLPDYTLYRVLLESNNHAEDLSRWPLAQRNASSARVWLASLAVQEQEAV